jgi:hypothetical protein
VAARRLAWAPAAALAILAAESMTLASAAISLPFRAITCPANTSSASGTHNARAITELGRPSVRHHGLTLSGYSLYGVKDAR